MKELLLVRTGADKQFSLTNERCLYLRNIYLNRIEGFMISL